MLEDGGMLEGELSEINLIDRLVKLWRESFTGALRFEHDAIIKILYFKSGDILSASTNDRADSIDEILTRAGKVSREHVRQALARRKENETLGDALLNLGFITRKELTWARRVQVVGVIRSIVEWETGSFTIVADYLPKRDEGTLFSLPQVLVELIVTDPDRPRFEKALDGGNAVFEKTAEFDDVFGRLGLNEDAEAITGYIDGTRTAAEVAVASGQDAFNVYKLIHALASLGIVTRHAPQVSLEVSRDDDYAYVGVADAADVWRPETPELAAPDPSFALEDDIPAPVESQGFDDGQFPSDDSVLDLNLEPLEADAAEPAPRAVLQPRAEAFDSTQHDKSPADVPAWDVPPAPTVVPIPAKIEGPAEAREAWGFDEAQVETARRARTRPLPPRPAPPPARKRPYGLILLALGAVVLAAAAWYGYRWLQQDRSPTIAALGTEELASSPAAAPSEPPVQVEAAPADVLIESGTAGVVPVSTETAVPSPGIVPATGERARIDQLARAYATNPEGNYTIQIQILCDPANVSVATRTSDQVWFVPQAINNRPCYRVFWGRYGTADEAQRAMATVPPSLRDRSAAVKPVPQPQQAP